MNNEPPFINSHAVVVSTTLFKSPLSYCELQHPQKILNFIPFFPVTNQGLNQQGFSNQGLNNQNPFTQQSLALPSTCNERLGQLVGDIFIGHEMIPQVLDLPPDYPLELTYR